MSIVGHMPLRICDRHEVNIDAQILIERGCREVRRGVYASCDSGSNHPDPQ
jgi:hypothetical protein